VLTDLNGPQPGYFLSENTNVGSSEFTTFVEPGGGVSGAQPMVCSITGIDLTCSGHLGPIDFYAGGNGAFPQAYTQLLDQPASDGTTPTLEDYTFYKVTFTVDFVT
jgi:hypothetical protein